LSDYELCNILKVYHLITVAFRNCMGLSEEPGIKYFWGPTVRSPRSELNKADHLCRRKSDKGTKGNQVAPLSLNYSPPLLAAILVVVFA